MLFASFGENFVFLVFCLDVTASAVVFVKVSMTFVICWFYGIDVFVVFISVAAWKCLPSAAFGKFGVQVREAVTAC